MLNDMIMLLFVVLIFGNIILAQTVHNVRIVQGRPYEDIKSPGYRNVPITGNSFIQWNLHVEVDDTIKIICDDIRMNKVNKGTNDCNHAHLTLNDGTDDLKICGENESGFQYTSNGPQLRIRLVVYDGFAFVKCTAYSSREFGLKILELRQHGSIYKINTTETLDYLSDTVSEEIDSSEHGVAKGTKTTTCDCGRANKPKSRITHGEEAGENEFPWMVFLKTYYQFGDRMTYFRCGGSVITHRHVLTAGHCLINMATLELADVENIRIRVGEHNIKIVSPNEKEILAERFYIHELFLKEWTHDIAIILTKEYIEFNQFIGPVCLSQVELPIVNHQVQILGWGDNETRDSSDVLRKAKALVIDRLLCNMSQWEICTKARPSATCSGDSGSPQVWVDPETNRYTQVSLASKASEDCYSGPNTQTDVVYFYKWIQDIINQSDSSQIICQKND